MSRPSSRPDSWLQSVNRWFQGSPKRKRIERSEGSAQAPAHVEFLENRQLLSATNGTQSASKDPADTPADTAATPGTTTTTTTTHGTDSSGRATTTVTVTTVTTDENGNTTTSTTSTTTVDSIEAETPTTGMDSDQAIASAVQSDGKIILVGAAQMNQHGDYDFAVTRLNADGSLDTTFGTNGKKTISFNLGGTDTDGNQVNSLDVANCVAIQNDGKIVIGGYAQRDGNGNFDFAVVRLNTDGSLDTTFSSDGKALVAFDYGGAGDDRATGVAIQADGKIVLVGTCQQNAGGTTDIAMARLNADGSLDPSFTGDGRKWIDLSGGGNDAGAAVAVQPDGSIVVVGFTDGEHGDDFAIARVTPDGSLDYSFSSDGKKTIAFDLGGSGTDRATSVALQSDGSIVIAGSATAKNGGSDFAVARIKINGELDKTFSGDGRKTIAFDMGADNEDEATGVAIQSDGSIVLGGYAQVSATGDLDFAAARLTSTGELDTNFGTGGKKDIPFNLGGSDYEVANGLSLQSDGKIIIIGAALKADPSDTDFAAVRLDTDGSLDTSFATGGKKTVGFDVTVEDED